VFVFEHATLYPVEGEIEEQAGAAEIGRALVRRVGDAVSLITYGGSLGKVLQAADQLAVDGIEAEVVDLRSLRPLDSEAILGSVAKTHRAVIVDEGWRTCSFARR
jgi:pyruvate dehydrogenase E1 component beta subunit